MKKGMVRFLATGMTAFTLMGTAVAFSPAKQVFAAEAETAAEASDSTRELKKISVVEANAYVKELVGDIAPYQEYENTKMYRVGNKVYSVSEFAQEPEVINEIIWNYQRAEDFYAECLAKGMIESKFKEHYEDTIEGGDYFVCARITGKIPMVNLSIATYTVNPVETAEITANKTLIRPGECACLHMSVNEGADESGVNWKIIQTEDFADFITVGNDAFVTGLKAGNVLVVAEADGEVKAFTHINIVE